MSSNASLFPLAAAGMTAFALVAMVFVTADFADAAEATPAAHATTAKPGPSCSCPQAAPNVLLKPPIADIKASLDESDEVAALESLQFALTEVADGSSYVWHRSHGRLSGIVKPTASFKSAAGDVCRHVEVALTSFELNRRIEAVACRQKNGVWALQG